MKTKRLLRVLSLSAFLLLIAPFYDSCNGHRIMQEETNAEPTADSTAVAVDSVQIDSTEVAKMEVDTSTNSMENYQPSFAEKAYEFIDDDDSENAFEFAKISITNISEFEMKDLEDVKEIHKTIFFQLKNFCFILIIIVTLLIAFFSFKNIKPVHWFSRLNLILLLITIVCIFGEGLFKNITQIKWGYYAFIVTNALIFCYSKQDKIVNPTS